VAHLSGIPWWIWAFAAVGALALLTGIVNLFFSLGRRPERMRMRSDVRVSDAEFLRALAGNCNLPLLEGGTARLLNNGDEFFERMLDAIRGARRSVNMMAYIWEPGAVSDTFFDALVERARAGVEVRVLLDAFGGLKVPGEDVERLRSAGGDVKRFRSLKPGKLLRFHKRNHRRAIVIDGRIGFTGGAAIADKWRGHAQDPEHWRDIMIEVTGCMATSLQSAFAELWGYAGREILSGDAHFPPQHEARPDDAEPIRHVHVSSTPASDVHPMRTLFLMSLQAARQRIWVATPYFVPDAFMREVMAERAADGVDVRLLLPNEHTDAKPIRWAAHSYYDELLSGGVRIFEYQPTFMHSKLLLIDETWSLVGSANMDIRSKELNTENVMGIAHRAFGADVAATFEADFANAREFHLDDWRRRGIARRVAERFFVLFAEQY
jgi:cardiolipin synthase A/B